MKAPRNCANGFTDFHHRFRQIPLGAPPRPAARSEGYGGRSQNELRPDEGASTKDRLHIFRRVRASLLRSADAGDPARIGVHLQVASGLQRRRNLHPRWPHHPGLHTPGDPPQALGHSHRPKSTMRAACAPVKLDSRCLCRRLSSPELIPSQLREFWVQKQVDATHG
jgi:hypothetical protein